MTSARQRVTYFTSRKSLVKYHLRHLRNCRASVTHCRLFTYRLLITNEQRQRDACINLQGDIPCNYLTATKFHLLWSHADISVGQLPSLIPWLLNLQAVEFCDCCGLGRIARNRPYFSKTEEDHDRIFFCRVSRSQGRESNPRVRAHITGVSSATSILVRLITQCVCVCLYLGQVRRDSACAKDFI